MDRKVREGREGRTEYSLDSSPVADRSTLFLVKGPLARPGKAVLLQAGVEGVVLWRGTKDGPADGDAASDGSRVGEGRVRGGRDEEGFLVVCDVGEDGGTLACDGDFVLGEGEVDEVRVGGD